MKGNADNIDISRWYLNTSEGYIVWKWQSSVRKIRIFPIVFKLLIRFYPSKSFECPSHHVVIPSCNCVSRIRWTFWCPIKILIVPKYRHRFIWVQHFTDNSTTLFANKFGENGYNYGFFYFNPLKHLICFNYVNFVCMCSN